MGNWLSSGNNHAMAEEADPSSKVIYVRTHDEWSSHWESQKKSDKLMVIDFKAAWCGPCRSIEPAVKALSTKFAEAVFIQIDVDELPQVSQAWNVNAMPTFVLLKGEKEVGRVVGANRNDLEAKIARCLKA